jgi:hypothetical protein
LGLRLQRGTRTEGKDGGGFDIDGGCVDCVVEKCLSLDNHGPGFMHCDYPKAGQTKGNVIRSCISINDGQREKGAGYGFGFVAWGAGLEECVIEKCLVVADKVSVKNSNKGLLFTDYISGFAAKEDKTQIRGCVFRSNVLQAGEGLSMVSNTLPEAKLEHVLLEGNTYLSQKGDPLFLQGEKRYSNVDEWRKATGQETREGKSTVGPIKTNSIILPDGFQRLTPRELEKSSLWKLLPE